MSSEKTKEQVFNDCLARAWQIVEFHCTTNEVPPLDELDEAQLENIEFGICAGIHASFEQMRADGLLPPLEPG